MESPVRDSTRKIFHLSKEGPLLHGINTTCLSCSLGLSVHSDWAALPYRPVDCVDLRAQSISSDRFGYAFNPYDSLTCTAPTAVTNLCPTDYTGSFRLAEKPYAGFILIGNAVDDSTGAVWIGADFCQMVFTATDF